jgi:hypothetical protein
MSCASCRFSHIQPDSPFLECRRRPPFLIGVGEKVEQAWPVVSNEDWCGDEEPVLTPVESLGPPRDPGAPERNRLRQR